MSEKQRKLFGAAAGGGAKKAPSLSVAEAKRHLTGVRGKKLPLRAKRKKLRMRKKGY